MKYGYIISWVFLLIPVFQAVNSLLIIISPQLHQIEPHHDSELAFAVVIDAHFKGVVEGQQWANSYCVDAGPVGHGDCKGSAGEAGKPRVTEPAVGLIPVIDPDDLYIDRGRESITVSCLVDPLCAD